MDRSRIWPGFRDEWVVYDDGDLLAIDKPVGISSQASDPAVPDDVVSRLRERLRERGLDPYLGVHQRLDRDTSGVLVLTRKREVNAAIAAQFEGRRAQKRYVACVTGWPKKRDRVTLRDAVAAGRDGLMRVVSGRGGPRPRGGDEAITDVQVLDRCGDRTMLSLELRTGRTHQARVQLAHAGAPIAGDVLYGGAAAGRLMLHSQVLSIEHPVTRRRIDLSAPLSSELSEWLAAGDPGAGIYDDERALDRRLRRALERRWAIGRSGSFGAIGETTAFRLINEEGDGLPRLAVDVYGSWLVAQLYGDDGPWADAARRERVIDRLGELGFDGVYLKIRPKQANTLADARRADMAPPLPVRGTPAPVDLAIVEAGMPLLVRLGDGLSTGLFLDQRSNRQHVRRIAEGKSFANLFSYTCAFTVAAARGGAARTVSVDASASALERGRANLANAGVPVGASHTFVADDAFRWLARTKRRGERFDLVALDPPSYSTTHRGRFVAYDDYASLAAAALAIVGPGGRLLACTNHRGISLARFRHILHDACRQADRAASQIKDLPEPPDFPAAPGGEGHMKSALVTLAS